MERPGLAYAVVFKTRGLLMVPAVVLVTLLYRLEWEHDLGVWSSGLSLFVLGVSLRVWSQIYVRYRIRSDHPLATAGPYAWVRNPIYLGNLLILAALCVLCELPWAILLVCPWAALVYHLAVRFEETRLTKRYGSSYEEYCRQVPRWCPRIPLQREPGNHDRVNLGRALLAEWHCLLLLLIPIAKEVIGPLLHLESGH